MLELSVIIGKEPLAMSKTNLYSRIRATVDEISRLKKLVSMLLNIDISNRSDDFQLVSTHAALQAERIACQMRNLVFTTGLVSKTKYMEQVTEPHDIHIIYKNESIEIQLPGLLPKRNVHSNTAFLNDPLHYALHKYMQDMHLPFYKHCVVCFVQIYDSSLGVERVRDYDNIEFKQILDTVATFVLHDDSGLLCDTHYTTKLEDRDCTKVYIMEKDKFPDWLKTFLIDNK